MRERATIIHSLLLLSVDNGSVGREMMIIFNLLGLLSDFLRKFNELVAKTRGLPLTQQLSAIILAAILFVEFFALICSKASENIILDSMLSRQLPIGILLGKVTSLAFLVR